MEYSLDFASSGLNLGNLEACLGDPATAERYYRQALAVDDLFLPAKMNLAVLLSGQGRNGEAEKLLREAPRPPRERRRGAYSLGLLLVETGSPTRPSSGWAGRRRSGRTTDARATTTGCCWHNGRLDEARRRGSPRVGAGAGAGTRGLSAGAGVAGGAAKSKQVGPCTTRPIPRHDS